MLCINTTVKKQNKIMNVFIYIFMQLKDNYLNLANFLFYKIVFFILFLLCIMFKSDVLNNNTLKLKKSEKIKAFDVFSQMRIPSAEKRNLIFYALESYFHIFLLVFTF